MRPKTIIRFLIGVFAVAVAGYIVYQFVFGSTLPPSAPATAVPVVANQQNQTFVLSATAYPSPPEGKAGSSMEETTASPYPPPEQASSNTLSENEAQVLFEIVSSASLARFTIYEELRGSPKDVIGETSMVTGEILVNQSDLSQSKVGVIQINARDFATDDERRNSAIRSRILQTDTYEYVLFTPNSIEGLTGSGEIGKTYSFRLTGDLTIRDITQSVTFDVTVIAESATRISGSAIATIRRSDFNLIVPNVPFVANVADKMKIELIFVAVAK